MQPETMEVVIGDVMARTLPMRSERLARVSLSNGAVDATMQRLDVDPETGDFIWLHEAKIADIENPGALEAVGENLREAAIRARPPA